MTEKTLASPKPSGIPIANNFKKVFRQYGGILSGMVVLIFCSVLLMTVFLPPITLLILFFRFR